MKRVLRRPFSFFGWFGRSFGRRCCEELGQLVEESDLGGVDDFAGGIEGVPGAFVDLGESGHATGSAGPFDLEGIAYEFFGVEVAARRPGEDAFTAFLADGLEFAEFALEEDAGFFVEFADGGVERGFVSGEFAFWDSPGTGGFVLPEGATGVDEENFEGGCGEGRG